MLHYGECGREPGKNDLSWEIAAGGLPSKNIMAAQLLRKISLRNQKIKSNIEAYISKTKKKNTKVFFVEAVQQQQKSPVVIGASLKVLQRKTASRSSKQLVEDKCQQLLKRQNKTMSTVNLSRSATNNDKKTQKECCLPEIQKKKVNVKNIIRPKLLELSFKGIFEDQRVQPIYQRLRQRIILLANRLVIKKPLGKSLSSVLGDGLFRKQSILSIG